MILNQDETKKRTPFSSCALFPKPPCICLCVCIVWDLNPHSWFILINWYFKKRTNWTQYILDTIYRYTIVYRYLFFVNKNEKSEFSNVKPIKLWNRDNEHIKHSNLALYCCTLTHITLYCCTLTHITLYCCTLTHITLYCCTLIISHCTVVHWLISLLRSWFSTFG